MLITLKTREIWLDPSTNLNIVARLKNKFRNHWYPSTLRKESTHHNIPLCVFRIITDTQEPLSAKPFAYEVVITLGSHVSVCVAPTNARSKLTLIFHWIQLYLTPFHTLVVLTCLQIDQKIFDWCLVHCRAKFIACVVRRSFYFHGFQNIRH